ncbi:hypothetical protein CLOP_g17467 [Closterium sp. NIES-67]|nr:hypothetical protein CLOP_g17467 [Closterium sp. NIES-67]
MVEDVHGHEGDVGSVGKVVMHPLMHWVIDSGCTSHMTPRADLLDEVKPPGKIKYVAAASGALLPVIGVGNAKVKGANGELVGLGNVLLVEGLSANLLSVRRLQKSKAEVTFGPTSCRAKLGKKVLWSLEEETSCIKDLWQLPIIPWNGKTPTAATAAAAKATAGGDATAPTDGVLEAVKKVQQQQTHDELQQPSRQVEVAVSEEEMSGVTEEGGAAEVEQQQQHESPPRVPHPPERPRRDVRPPVRLTYGGRGKPNVVQAGSVVEQIEEDEIAHCYWAPIPEPKTREEALNGPNGENLFLLQEKDEILMLLVYVDDILLFSASTALLDSAEQMLEMQFKCSKMGEVKYYLGMPVERDVEKGVLRLHQRKYCEGLAEKYGLQDGGKPATPLPSGFTVEPYS